MRGYFTSEGLWISSRPSTGGTQARRAGLLLDRDGVLVEEVGFLSSPGEVRLMPGAAALVARANRADIPVAVLSNQSGIARGYFGWDNYKVVEAEIARQLAHEHARLDLVIACSFHPDHPQRPSENYEYWRKPGPGMVLLAADMLGLDRQRSWMIGDKRSDMEAAMAAGLAHGIHVLTGHGAGERPHVRAMIPSAFTIHEAASIADAAVILSETWPILG